MFFIAASSLIASTPSAYSQPDKVLYELQQRCGKLAKTFAEDWKTRTFQTAHGTFQEGYENHYNARLNKCFYLEIITIHGRVGFMRNLSLFDLNDNKEFGTYAEGPTPQTLVHCEVRGQICKSEAEWRELAKPYLEE
jgi:hypothetical protein